MKEGTKVRYVGPSGGDRRGEVLKQYDLSGLHITKVRWNDGQTWTVRTEHVEEVS